MDLEARKATEKVNLLWFLSEWFGHFVGELIEPLSPVEVGKREELW